MFMLSLWKVGRNQKLSVGVIRDDRVGLLDLLRVGAFQDTMPHLTKLSV